MVMAAGRCSVRVADLRLPLRGALAQAEIEPIQVEPEVHFVAWPPCIALIAGNPVRNAIEAVDLDAVSDRSGRRGPPEPGRPVELSAHPRCGGVLLPDDPPEHRPGLFPTRHSRR